MSTLVFRLMNFPIQRRDLLPYALITAWVLSMISLPIALWTIGDEALAYSTTASVLLLASASAVLMSKAWGWPRAVQSGLTIMLLGWGIEFIGSRTGFPFGSYSYTQSLQPQLFGVPLLIPLAWMMMMPPAWAVAQCMVGHHRLAFVVTSALAFTAWDMFLDPQMVNWGFWVWHDPGTWNYFGIPFMNFAGWLLAAILMTSVVRPPLLPRAVLAPLLTIYGITIFLQTIGVGMFWSMPGAALCGFVAMTACFIPALKRYLKQHNVA
ncbi:MAG: carotenoid biosynthesis protein [Anaerolineae bacterium]